MIDCFSDMFKLQKKFTEEFFEKTHNIDIKALLCDKEELGKHSREYILAAINKCSELVKDMNDNDWNDDNNSLELIYEDKNFRVVCNESEEEEVGEEKEEEYVEDINGYKVNMVQLKCMADRFGLSVEEIKETVKTSICDYSKK